MNTYLDVITKHYADFEGRATRTQYWTFTLVNIVLSIVLGIVDGVLASVVGFGFVGILFSLALLVPGIAVAIRRLHDTGKSGFWLFIALIPLIGFIVLIVFFVMDSQPGSNKYGPNPKGRGGRDLVDDYDDRDPR